MLEIEKKFLVTSFLFEQEATRQKKIIQGYLNSNPTRIVRIRTEETFITKDLSHLNNTEAINHHFKMKVHETGYITIKGKGNTSGTTRFEWEKEIPTLEAKNLIKLCDDDLIKKTRYEIPIGNHTYEVDVFQGNNKGLVIAEIELKSENEIFEKPFWLGNEVTGDQKYYNAYLSKYPYKTWKRD